jgi:integrase
MPHTHWVVKNDHRLVAFDGQLWLERRPHKSPNWSVRTCHKGSELTKTTGSPLVGDAKAFAEKWFRAILTRIEAGEPPTEPTLATAYHGFINYHEHDLLTTGASNPKKIRNYKSLWNGVAPFLGQTRLSEVTSQKLEAFRTWRQKTSREKPSPRTLTEKTMHNYMGLIRLVLKYGARHGWLKYLPEFPEVRLKHDHPDWFTPEQLQTLLVTSSNRIGDTRLDGNNAAKHIRAERRELHAFIMFMADACCRVDEVLALRWCDVQPHRDNDKVPPFKRQVLLDIRTGHSKTGARQGLGTVGVLTALTTLRDLHPDAAGDDRLFKTSHQRAMAKLLDAAHLRVDDKGRRRNSKTLRHTSIMLRFLREPTLNIQELARIAGTSPGVLDRYYLSHLTGSRVSERLMAKAIAEFGEPQPPEQYTWATSAGVIKHSVKRSA